MSIRWTLLLTYLLVALVAAGTLGLYLEHDMSRRYVGSLQAELAVQASLIADLAGQDFISPKSRASLQKTALRLGKEGHSRITFIDRKGVVWGDSEQNPAGMENHASRPEFKQALATGQGQSLRYSRTLKVNMLYVARAVKSKTSHEMLGVVRVAVPLHQLAAALGKIRTLTITGILLATILGFLLSALFSQKIGGAIHTLTLAARRFAAGELEDKVHLAGNRELVGLGESFNEMAARIREMLRELREEKQKATTILEKLGEAIIVTDTGGRIIECNQTAEQIFGFARDKIIGLGVVDATQNIALEGAIKQALASGGAADAEVTLLFPQPRTLKVIVTPLAAESPLGAVAVLHDVTELRRLESVRREFVSNASHELRTPITAIKALTEILLAGGKDDPEVKERFFQDLQNQADRLSALVNDLLNLAAIEGREIPQELSTVDLSALAQETISQIAPLAEARGVKLSLDSPETLTLVTNHLALRQILTNLLDNAVKYTESEGEAGLRAARQGDEIALTVWDTGIGIPSADLPHLFERFYRVDKARSRALGGTGLGLAIVKHLTESLGGTVTVKSEIAKGSEFTLLLPVSLPTD
jgi:two-component system, OmpR family, phosphate regulon sensor histidine kinase PhoR